MRARDYMSLAIDQLRRRKVVTGLCSAGISIGCAAIIVAMSLGQSAQIYAEKELNSFLKMDEITVTPIQNKGDEVNKDVDNRGKLTKQKLNLVRNLPHVKAASPFEEVGYFSMHTTDDRSNNVQVIGTDLEQLANFNHQFRQGGPSDVADTIILNYGAEYGLLDRATLEPLIQKQNQDPFNEEITQQLENIQKLHTPLFQRQVRFERADTADQHKPTTSTMRITSVIKKPADASTDSAKYDKKAYTSLETAALIREQLKLNQGPDAPPASEVGTYKSILVKVDDQNNVEQVEKQIKKLMLNTQTNLKQKERLEDTFKMVRTIALGVGLFVLVIASISIVVAMTMSTHQRRRQIGIMKVLGANLRQIRNMFIIEAALLGLLGGLIGVMISYWLVWGINGAAARATEAGQGFIFIPLINIPLGIFFAVLTGVLSGIYPALSASRTDALTAIKRD
ncbi:ABC transporter permease [Paenibacillus taiwanensis]|uniref:ABC transporter permease n=1 Tax=Paenibacillus taiwanensis TaxID=401638 RepID=UPI00041BCCDA|nr:FtsX-like permease family protein [Paenibacillus taiwanensis]